MAAKQQETAARVERVPWDELAEYVVRRHRLGEHIGIEGPTGSGKSVMALLLLEQLGAKRSRNGRPVHITVLATKAEDRTLGLLDWKRISSLDEWPPAYGDEQVILWPARGGRSGERTARQRAVFGEVLDEVMQPGVGRQIVYIDEVAYFEDAPPYGLGLGPVVTRFWRESRSSKVTLMAATQRPTRVSRYMWSEPWWLFLFRTEDEDDLKRVAQLSGFKETVLEVVPTLGPHEFLMLRRRPERLAVVSQVRL